MDEPWKSLTAIYYGKRNWLYDFSPEAFGVSLSGIALEKGIKPSLLPLPTTDKLQGRLSEKQPV